MCVTNVGTVVYSAIYLETLGNDVCGLPRVDLLVNGQAWSVGLSGHWVHTPVMNLGLIRQPQQTKLKIPISLDEILNELCG